MVAEYVIGFVEIGRYQFENEFLTCYKYAIRSRSEVSHRQYYKLTQNLTNQAHNAGCALRPWERSHGSAPVGPTLHESGFEPVGAEERSYENAA